jgi:hypothetical protein
LFYLEVTDFDNTEPPLPEEDQAQDKLPPLISLHAIAGIHTEDTMQLCIAISSYELTALLDSGSAHNFISTVAARRVGLHFHYS